MAVLRSPAVMVDAETAALLRSWGVRGLLESVARADGQRLPVQLRALLDELDEVALACPIGHPGRPGKDRSVIVAATTTITEAATVSGISERQLRRLVSSGQLAGRRHGHRWALDAAAVAKLAALRGVTEEA